MGIECLRVPRRGRTFGAEDHTMQLLFLRISPSFIRLCKYFRSPSFKEIVETITQTIETQLQLITSCCSNDPRKKKLANSPLHFG